MLKPAAPRRSPWDAWYRRALPTYWMLLFALTHLPRLEFDVGVADSDKYAHALAFAGLAFLYWRALATAYPPRSVRFALAAGAVLLGYAAVDEWLQRFTGRSVDLRDWLFGAGGIVGALVALELLRRRAHARPATQK